MIYTFTFNPALDVTGFVDDLTPNEKNYVDHVQYLPGGNGINAGIIASRLSGQVLLSGYLGGANGERIRRLLDTEGVRHNFIPIKNETRMNVTISHRHGHFQTRLSFPGPVITSEEEQRFFDSLAGIHESDIVLFGGSLPQGLETSSIKKAIKKLQTRKCRILVDMPSRPLGDVLSAGPDFIKPNLKEFQELVGDNISDAPAIIASARKKLSHIPNVCVSSVEGGALFLTRDEVWFGKIPDVEIYSTVGAGDSLVGAMAYIWEKEPEAKPDKLLNYGLAASCATLTKKGSTLGDKNDIENFLSKIILKKISG